MTEYTHACIAACKVTHLALGNALAAAIDPDVGGSETFTKGMPCYPAGTTFSGVGPAREASQAETARATFPLLMARGYALVSEFNGPGPWPELNALGFVDEQILLAKDGIDLIAGERAEIEAIGVSFLVSLGYVI